MIERNIDYLQFTALVPEFLCIEKQFTPCPPVRFFKRGYIDEIGSRLYFGNSNPKATKALVIMTGAALQKLRDRGNSEAEIAQFAINQGGNISRLDMAVTEWVDEFLITMQDVENWVKWDLVDSTLMKYGAKKIEAIHQENNAIETLYIGDMKKRGEYGIFRAYDKGIELDLGQYMATRLEYEDRGEKAENSLKRIAETGDVGAVFRSRFNVYAANFERIIESEAVEIARGNGREKETVFEALDARWEWLMKQVAPAIKDAYQKDVKLGLKFNRFYWLLREIGIGHGEALVAIRQIERGG